MADSPTIVEYPGIHIAHNDKPRWCEVNGERVPSVTTALGILDKPALKFWAQNQTIEGVVRLYDMYEGTVPARTFGQLKGALSDNRLCFYQKTSAAADAGTALHLATEQWAEDGIIPNIADYEPRVRPHIRAFAKFLRDYEPEFVESETIVGSAKYGFAGRLDAKMLFHGRVATERGLTGLVLGDYKSAKQIHPLTMFRQLEGYEGASVECGFAPTDHRCVVRLGADGEYEVAESCATYQQFLNCLAVYRDNKAIEKAAKA